MIYLSDLIFGGVMFGSVWALEIICYKVAYGSLHDYIDSWKRDLRKLTT